MEPGGYLLRSFSRGVFTLQVVRTSLGRRTQLRRVDFVLDGERQKKDRQAPFTTSVRPSSLPVGRHTLTANAYTKRGKRRTRTLAFQVSDCEAAAFSAGMIGKLPGSYADVELRARTGGPKLKKVKFTLPPTLRMKTGRVAGRRIGTIKLTGKSGTRSVESLRFTRHGHGAARLLDHSKAQFEASLSRHGKKRTVTVSGLEDQQATGISVLLKGRKTRLFRNPTNCTTHRFSATMTSTSDQRLTLKRSLKMCKSGKPGK